MLYHLRNSQMESKIAEQSLKQFGRLPKEMEEAPELLEGLDIYLDAFFELSSERSIGMGEGPIPRSAIHEYCEREAIEGDLKQDLMYHVRAMDNAYLEFQSQKYKEK